MTYPNTPGQPPQVPYDPYAAQYPPPQQPWPAPPLAVKKRKVWPWVVGGVVLLLVVIGSAGNKTKPGSTAGAALPAAAAPAAPSAPGPAAPVEAPTVSAPAANTIPQGTWIVPTEVAPGRYRSAGVEEGLFEYCQITTEDANGKVLEWENVGGAGEPLIVKVSKNAATVTNSGCATFTKIG